MRKLFTLIHLAIFAHIAFAAEPTPPLFTAPLPELPANQEVRMDVVTLRPGLVGPAHRHDAYVYVYVLEGTVEMGVEGGETQTLTAGEVFTEVPTDVHTVMRNPSETEAAKFVAFMIKTAGAPGATRIAPATP